MPDYDETTIPQTIPRSSPRPRRLDRSRERYPRDGSLDEVYVERRQIRRDNHSPKGRLTIRHNELIRSPRYQSRSADPPRRRDSVSRHENYSSDDDDSDSDYKRSRAISKRKSDRHLKIVPCGDTCADHPHRARSRNSSRGRGRGRGRDTDSESESGYCSSGEENEKSRKHRNRKLLYTGLACVTTVAAANNIYQNTKAHHARRNQYREGEMCSSEVKRLKSKAFLMDAFTVGVVAVGLNNARMGWKRVEAIKQEGKGK